MQMPLHNLNVRINEKYRFLHPDNKILFNQSNRDKSWTNNLQSFLSLHQLQLMCTVYWYKMCTYSWFFSIACHFSHDSHKAVKSASAQMDPLDLLAWWWTWCGNGHIKNQLQRSVLAVVCLLFVCDLIALMCNPSLHSGNIPTGWYHPIR